MLPLPPIDSGTYAAIQGMRQSEDKSDQVRTTQNRDKDIAATDHFEHTVESADAVQPIHDETPHSDPRKKKSDKRPYHDDESDGDSVEHLDLQA